MNAPGIYDGIPMADYLADPCVAPSLTSGLAHLIISKSLAHARNASPRLNPDYVPREDSRFDIGAAAHSVFCEGLDNVMVVQADDWRTKAAQELRKNARAEGRIALLAKHYHAVKQMAAVASDYLKNSPIGARFENSKAEQVVIWKEGNVWLRARPDVMSADRKMLLNYKTCELAEPSSFIRRMPGLGYDISAAFYERGMRALGHEAEEVFLAQEIEPPYECALIGLDPAMREIATRRVEEAINLWGAAIQSGKWIGYGYRIHYATPSTWQLRDDEERTLTWEERLADALEP